MTVNEVVEIVCGGLHDNKLSDNGDRILADICHRVSSSINDKEDYFHNLRVFHFIDSPMSGLDVPYFMKTVDFIVIIQEVLHYLECRNELRVE
jgi:hypothetical protein